MRFISVQDKQIKFIKQIKNEIKLIYFTLH